MLKDIGGLINIEIGHGFDMSDYLNATCKTSYIKGGAFWDHDAKWFSSKLEFEHFQQISEVVESNLSRNQYIFEIIAPYKRGLYFNFNIEVEDFSFPGSNRCIFDVFCHRIGKEILWIFFRFYFFTKAKIVLGYSSTIIKTCSIKPNQSLPVS